MTDPIDAFIARWAGVAASELATAQSFVIDLCHLLAVDAPHPTPAQDYMFERPVTFRHGDGGSSAGRIDCYRRGCFVLEAKILERLVALNAERAAEETQGHIRWLRPEFQNPRGATQAGLGVSQATICDSHEEVGPPPAPPAPWPSTLPEQMAALAAALTAQPQSETKLATRFTSKGKWKSRLPELLATLATLGRARKLEDGRWLG